MKKRYQLHGIALVVASILICLLMVSSMVGTAEAARREFVRFGGSNPGGSWFTMVGGISAVMNKQIKKLNVTPIATGGSADNNRLARKHELDTWLTHSLTAYDNYNGVGLFKGKGAFKDFRLLSGVYESWHHFVVLADSDTRTLSDLKGKIVCIGAAGSGAAVNSENIFRAIGLWDQIKPESWTFDACGRGLLDGQVGAISFSSAPMPAIVTVEAMKKIRLIELSDEEFKKVLSEFPAYKKGMMPAGAYKTWQKEYPCIAFQVYWAAHKKAKSKWIYELMKVAFDPENAKTLGRIHRQWKTLAPSFDSMKAMGIPLHDGAVKFWKEKGETIPSELIEK